MTAPHILQFRESISLEEHHTLTEQGMLDRLLHDRARNTIATELLESDFLTVQHHEPSSDNQMRHCFDYTLGLLDPSDTETFTKQLNATYRAGLIKAAHLARTQANIYSRLDQGNCRFVIADALRALARACDLTDDRT